MRFIPGVGEALQSAEAAGEHVTGLPVDAHWNGKGHAIAARIIDRWLRQERLPENVAMNQVNPVRR